MKELKLHKNELKYLKECVYSSVLLGHESDLGNRILKKIDKALSITDVRKSFYCHDDAIGEGRCEKQCSWCKCNDPDKNDL